MSCTAAGAVTVVKALAMFIPAKKLSILIDAGPVPAAGVGLEVGAGGAAGIVAAAGI